MVSNTTKITPLQFKKIKNSLFSEYSIAERGRFSHYIGAENEHLWREIGEKCPIPADSKLTLVDKTNVVWERLEAEPSPRRFIEICRVIAQHIKYVSCLSETGTTDIFSIFLWEIREAFEKCGLGKLIKSKSSKYNSMLICDIDYIGNDFGMKESAKFVTNVFSSKIISELVQQKVYMSKKKWVFSKMSFKIKPPFAEAGVEVERRK